ncbi:SIMPL domain-containing protein [Kitasatospora sp. NPDC058170]|uniref:SIMPL domain-containing protein n=1 Tax=Kitasatospora sp. NPDC058170 TaxID=3346364 RepID=UPI0036DC1E11
MFDTQPIATPWGVSLSGSASVDATPDIAHLRLAIRETRLKPGEAFEVARGAVNRVREALRRHRVPDAAVSASRLNLQSSWSFAGGERHFLGYECTASFVIELRELDSLELLLIDAVEAGANQVDGVEFDVSAKAELQAQARREAVAAAREKAEQYAQAAGVRLGPVVHITDVNPNELPAGFRLHAGGGGGGEAALAPGKISISAVVVLGLAIIGG